MKVQEWSQSDIGMFCYKTKMRDGVQWLVVQIIKQKYYIKKRESPFETTRKSRLIQKMYGIENTLIRSNTNLERQTQNR